MLDKVIEEFPNPGDVPWKEFKQASAKKLASEGDELFGDFTRHLTSEFNSATFLQFLQTLTGVDALISDPYFFGGGLHQIEPGGFLKVHVDFSRHETLRIDRRLNAIVYLNRDWEPAWGGALEFWDADMTHMVEHVLPVFNRCVIFATPDANHGHPDPLACPPGRTRRSLAFFYYRNDLAADEAADTTSRAIASDRASGSGARGPSSNGSRRPSSSTSRATWGAARGPRPAAGAARLPSSPLEDVRRSQPCGRFRCPTSSSTRSSSLPRATPSPRAGGARRQG